MCKRGVDGTFGKSCRVGDRTNACTDMTPFISCEVPVKVQVNDKRGWPLIVPDQITHQHIENVNVDWNAVFESEISK